MHRTAFQGLQDHSAYRGRGRVLSILKERPEISRKELEGQLNISRQALNELLGKLEKGGLVVRTPSETDRRVMMIRLTEKGRVAAVESDEGIHPLTGLLSCLNEEEKASFSDYLDRILNAQNGSANHCAGCTGPEQCSHDYLKYGHKKPNPKYCKYIHLFTDDLVSDEAGTI